MNDQTSSKFHRIACFGYGSIVYVLFLGIFTYTIGFVAGAVVPKHIDGGSPGPLAESITINALLLSLFVIQHTIMARPWFKKSWTQIIPVPIERSTFVLATCCILALIFWQWRPLPASVWHVEGSAATALYALSGFGWLLVLYSTCCIDHFGLFGLRQVVLHLLGKKHADPTFVMPWLYKLVRNPLMLGFLIAFWSTPNMTRGHLLFAALVTGYVFMGIWFEERDLLAHLGENYRAYRASTPMLLPFPRTKAAAFGRAAMPSVDASNSR